MTPTPSSIKDSVELLLEGMAGPRPERRKTTPQSDGEASASYHAEHGVRRARTSDSAGPKVVVDRPVVGSLAPEPVAAPAPPKSAPGSRESVSTFVPARVLRRRVAMAIVAGALFVLLSFVALRLTGRHESAAASMPPVETLPPSQGVASPVEAPGATPIVSKLTIAPAPSVAPPVSALTGSTQPAQGDDSHTSAPAAASRHHHADVDQGRTRDAPTGPGDLGEFKTKF